MSTCHRHSSIMPQMHARQAARPVQCGACQARNQGVSSRRAAMLSLLPLLSAGSASAAVPNVVPFLKGSGARGFFADEEEQLVKMREEAELKAREELDAERSEFENEARKNQKGLCATPFGVDVVGITELIALVGAIVGGLAARQRKREAERLNEQLRKINLQLRQQARAGTMYAPGLSYAPQVSSLSAKTDAAPSTAGEAVAARSNGSAVESTGATATLTKPADAPAENGAGLSTMDEDISPEQVNCRETMREGKRLLRNGQGGSAIVRFEKALLMSQKIEDKVLQRRAMRGMAASSRMQGNNQSAIKYLKQVLELSQDMQEYTGDADAYGSIADIYADIGDFDEAAKYYDLYIGNMQTS